MTYKKNVRRFNLYKSKFLLYLPRQPRAGYGARGIRGIHVRAKYYYILSTIVYTPVTYILLTFSLQILPLISLTIYRNTNRK